MNSYVVAGLLLIVIGPLLVDGSPSRLDRAVACGFRLSVNLAAAGLMAWGLIK